MPMLIPPKPWSAPNIGGYLSNQSLIMRVRGSTMQINQLFAQHKQGKLSQVRNAFMHSHASCILYTSGLVGSNTDLGGRSHPSQALGSCILPAGRTIQATQAAVMPAVDRCTTRPVLGIPCVSTRAYRSPFPGKVQSYPRDTATDSCSCTPASAAYESVQVHQTQHHLIECLVLLFALPGAGQEFRPCNKDRVAELACIWCAVSICAVTGMGCLEGTCRVTIEFWGSVRYASLQVGSSFRTWCKQS